MFSRCFADAWADYEATPELVGKLKKGKMLHIQATNLAAAAMTFPFPLVDSSGNSFAGANEGHRPTKVFREPKKRSEGSGGAFEASP
jgi:hypothetical protein